MSEPTARELARTITSVLSAEDATIEELRAIAAAALALASDGMARTAVARSARQVLRELREARAREVLRVRARRRTLSDDFVVAEVMAEMLAEMGMD